MVRRTLLAFVLPFILSLALAPMDDPPPVRLSVTPVYAFQGRVVTVLIRLGADSIRWVCYGYLGPEERRSCREVTPTSPRTITEWWNETRVLPAGQYVVYAEVGYVRDGTVSRYHQSRPLRVLGRLQTEW